MRRYWIIWFSLLLLFTDGLTSCGKTESENNGLVGLWVSTKVDTLTQYIKPVKPETFVSYEMKNCTLQISADGSLKMVKAGDTILGRWNPAKLDSIQLDFSKDYSRRVAVDLADKHNLVISERLGWMTWSSSCGGGTNVVENYECKISKHFTRR